MGVERAFAKARTLSSTDVTGTERDAPDVSAHPISRFRGYPATRLSVYMTFQDHAGHKGLETQLVRRARNARISGLTVFEALEGFGGSGEVHRTHLVSDNTPLAIVIVDTPDKVASFLDLAADLLKDARIYLDEVEVIEF